MAAKIQIPDQLKADLPQNKWGKLLAATPIVMTVIATMLAGLASSEMTRAQYDRSLAAQLQSKAGDQWSYFQAKKLRSALNQDALDLLRATDDVQFMDSQDLKDLDPVAFRALFAGQLPTPPQVKFDTAVNTALTAVENSRPESEITADLAKISDAALADALNAARQSTLDYDKAMKPVYDALGRLEPAATASGKDKLRNFVASRFRIQAARYDAESRLNQSIASIYELQVRKGNISAERHHQRSQRFFYGMLAGQMGVIVSTFAIAARKKNLLWSLAAAAGLVAVSFSVYVYLCL